MFEMMNEAGGDNIVRRCADRKPSSEASPEFWSSLLSERAAAEIEYAKRLTRCKTSAAAQYKKLTAASQNELSEVFALYVEDTQEKSRNGISQWIEHDARRNPLGQTTRDHHSVPDNTRSLYTRTKQLLDQQKAKEAKVERTRRTYLKKVVRADHAKNYQSDLDGGRKAMALQTSAEEALEKYRSCYEEEKLGREMFLKKNEALKNEWLANNQKDTMQIVVGLQSFTETLKAAETHGNVRSLQGNGNNHLDKMLEILNSMDVEQMSNDRADTHMVTHVFPEFQEYCSEEAVKELSDLHSGSMKTLHDKASVSKSTTHAQHSTVTNSHAHVKDCNDSDDDSIEEIFCEDGDTTPRREKLPLKSFFSNHETGKRDDTTPTNVSEMKDVYVIVKKEYEKQRQGELTLRIGMKIKQKAAPSDDGFAYGWTRKNKLTPKKHGCYPVECVTLYKK